jgi:hypothetical protein
MVYLKDVIFVEDGVEGIAEAVRRFIWEESLLMFGASQPSVIQKFVERLTEEKEEKE